MDQEAVIIGFRRHPLLLLDDFRCYLFEVVCADIQMDTISAGA